MTISELEQQLLQLSPNEKLHIIQLLAQSLTTQNNNTQAENTLLNQLASTNATVWSPQADNRSVQALSDLLAKAKENSHG